MPTTCVWRAARSRCASDSRSCRTHPRPGRSRRPRQCAEPSKPRLRRQVHRRELPWAYRPEVLAGRQRCSGSDPSRLRVAVQHHACPCDPSCSSSCEGHRCARENGEAHFGMHLSYPRVSGQCAVSCHTVTFSEVIEGVLAPIPGHSPDREARFPRIDGSCGRRLSSYGSDLWSRLVAATEGRLCVTVKSL